MKSRIFQSLTFSLVITIIIVWVVVGLGMFRPLRQKILDSRADIVATIASEIEQAEYPKKRALEFEEKLHIDIKLRKKKPEPPRKRHPIMMLERDGYFIYTPPGPRAPFVTEINLRNKKLYLIVRFPHDISEPERNSHWFFLALIVLIGGVSWVLSLWTFKPLRKASEAMEQIAEGNFAHRVTEDIGPAKDAFNTMADKVQTLIIGQRHLIASLSHELRTPLTRLRLQTELLEGEISSEKLSSLNQDIDELDELVEMMLLSAKMEQGKLALRLGRVSILDLVLEGLSKVDLGERYLKLEVPSEVEIMADRVLILRIVLNLLSNIGRYTPKLCTVSISAKEIGENVEFVVADTGYGVSDDFLTEIFEPFSREETSRSKLTGGWGLGLGFVKNVVDLHQGKITIEHNKPKGLLVRIQFPKEMSLEN